MAKRVKTYEILGNAVSVEYDENAFDSEYEKKLCFPYYNDCLISDYVKGSVELPGGILDSSGSDFEELVASRMLNHLNFKGCKEFVDMGFSFESTPFLFAYSCIKNFNKKLFPNFTFEGMCDVGAMFRFCMYLESVDLSEFYHQDISRISQMLDSCWELRTVNFSNWDFTGIKVFHTFGTDWSCSPVLSRVVLVGCSGPLYEIIRDIVYNSIVREIAHTHSKTVGDVDGNFVMHMEDVESFMSGEHRSDSTTIIVSPDRYAEVKSLIEKAYKDVYQECKRTYFSNSFPRRDRFKELVKVALPNGNTDSETTSLLVDKIREAFSKGNNEKEIYNLLKEEGRSDYDIVCAMACVGFDLGISNNDIVSSYCRKVINPQIRDVLKPNSGVTVGEVVGSLYKSYPKALVDHAMVLYTWEMSPSVVE